SKVTSGRRSVVLNAATVRVVPSLNSTTSPGANRVWGRSVKTSTTTAPLRPCGRTIRPTTTRSPGTSVDKLDLGGYAFFVGGGAGHRADRPGDTPAATDHPPHVSLGGAHLGEDLVGPLLGDGPVDGVGVVDDLFDHVLDDPFDDLALRHAQLSSDSDSASSAASSSAASSAAASSDSAAVASSSASAAGSSAASGSGAAGSSFLAPTVW